MNSNIRRKIPVTGALLLAISSIMISCTKEVPYKQVYKENVEAKSTLSPDDEYLFVASSDLSNNDDAGLSSALPFWQGTEKVVKFRFTENTLQVVESGDDARIAKDNTLNNRVLLEIPIKHVQYRCAEDRYGKCTNKEEENSELNWTKKANFIPDFNSMKTTGMSVLPVEMQQLYGFSCFNETSSRFLNYELKDGSLNIQIEKVFRGTPACLGTQMYSINSVDELQSQIIYHYSFNKLSKVTSPNYKKIDYPRADKDTFGFFTSENRKYDVDLSRTQPNQKEWMNRWNPDRKEIVYYMSDNFNKPQYKSIKEATRTAFDRVNAGLKAAGLEMRLVIKDPDHKQPGDARNSMIVMVEDPVSGGPLGYGPTVANPRTGEIISGRVAMYYGNFVQGVRYTYDEVVRELQNSGDIDLTKSYEKTKPTAATETVQAAISDAMKAKLSADTYSRYMHAETVGYKVGNSYSNAKKGSTDIPQQGSLVAKANVKQNSAALRQQVHAQLKNMTKMSARYNARTSLKAAADENEGIQQNAAVQTIDTLSAQSKYCNYPSELFPFSEYIKKALTGKLGKNMKLWNDLSDSEKEQVIAIIMPEIWVPTLVHELGHNLGLRHNFQGSEDRLNFYTEGELAKMGVKHEIPYSSVMDYGYSELNLLPTLGKYDIAALRFGYSRKVTTETGATVDVPETLAKLQTEKKDLALRDFKYCSDESVDLSANCKRFDKGTTLTEIVNHLIESYQQRYYVRNFRNGRENFSKVQEGGYYSGRLDNFQYIRNFMEIYSSIKNQFALDDDSLDWTFDPELKDLKQAALISGRFFLNVMKTPEVLCAVANKDNLHLVTDIGALKSIDPSANSCWDIQLADPNQVMVAQGGKFFNDVRFRSNPSQYADQIDIRGIGPDKLAAAEALFVRMTSEVRQHEDNYMDIKDLAPEISSTVASLLFDQMDTDVEFRDQAGNLYLNTKWKYNVFSAPNSVNKGKDTHWFDVPMVESAQRRMGLPNHKVSFQEKLLNIITKRMGSSQSHYAEDKAFLEQFRVNRIAKTTVMNSENTVSSRDVGSFKAVALANNTIALDAMSSITKSDLLTSMKQKELEDLRIARTAVRRASTPAPTTDAKFKDVTINDINMFKAGALPAKDKLEYLLTILPGAEEPK